MPRKRFTNEQIAFALRQAENGTTVDEVSLTPRANFRAFQVTEALDALVRLRGRPKSLRVDNVLLSEEGQLAGHQVSVREHALAA